METRNEETGKRARVISIVVNAHNKREKNERKKKKTPNGRTEERARDTRKPFTTALSDELPSRYRALSNGNRPVTPRCDRPPPSTGEGWRRPTRRRRRQPAHSSAAAVRSRSHTTTLAGARVEKTREFLYFFFHRYFQTPLPIGFVAVKITHTHTIFICFNV